MARPLHHIEDDDFRNPDPLGKLVLQVALITPIVIMLCMIVQAVVVREFAPALLGPIGMAAGMQFVLLFMVVSPDPRHWWGAWFGTTIKVNSARLPEGTKVEDIRVWLKECVKWPYIEENATEYKFLRKRDAAMFKLTWG